MVQLNFVIQKPIYSLIMLFFNIIFPYSFLRIGEINILLARTHEHANANVRTPVEP